MSPVAHVDVSAAVPSNWSREDIEDVAHLLAMHAEELGLAHVTVTTHQGWEGFRPSQTPGGWDLDAGE